MAELQATEWLNGDLHNYNIDGVSFIHHDIDHNPTAQDMPFNFCDILYAQFTYKNKSRYRIAIAIAHTHEIKIGHSWGDSIVWKTI